MNRLTMGLGCLALLGGGLLLNAADEPAKKAEKAPKAKAAATSEESGKEATSDKKAKDQEEEQRWMEMKLLRSQEVFAELTAGNLEGVAKRARAMQAADILEFWF